MTSKPNADLQQLVQSLQPRADELALKLVVRTCGDRDLRCCILHAQSEHDCRWFRRQRPRGAVCGAAAQRQACCQLAVLTVTCVFDNQ